MPDYITCEDLIKASIAELNEALIKEGKEHQFPSDSRLYTLWSAKKKNGKPDNDVPPFNMLSTVMNV